MYGNKRRDRFESATLKSGHLQHISLTYLYAKSVMLERNRKYIV